MKPGGLKPKTVPPRYLGQPSPFTHPHLIKHGEYCLQWTADLVKCHFFIYFLRKACFSSGEVTPGLSQTEYELRRHRLASLIEAQAERLGPSASSSTHVAIILSHPTRYMTNDIPYPFHQNQVSTWFQGAFSSEFFRKEKKLDFPLLPFPG